MKLHEIILGVVFMTLIVSGFMVFYSNGVSVYAPSDYNETQLQVYQDQLGEIEAIGNNTKNTLSTIGQDNSNLFDIIGGIFSSGYNAALVVAQSFDSLFTITTSGVASIPTGSDSFGNVLTAVLMTSILIAIFVGILLYILVGRERV